MSKSPFKSLPYKNRCHVLVTFEFHVPPINVPTLSPFMAFEMLSGFVRLKTTTASERTMIVTSVYSKPTSNSDLLYKVIYILSFIFIFVTIVFIYCIKNRNNFIPIKYLVLIFKKFIRVK